MLGGHTCAVPVWGYLGKFQYQGQKNDIFRVTVIITNTPHFLTNAKKFKNVVSFALDTTEVELAHLLPGTVRWFYSSQGKTGRSDTSGNNNTF